MTPPTVLPLLTACGSVTAQYEVARTAALSDPGTAAGDFAPDAQVLLSGELVDAIVGEAVLGLPIEGALDLGLVALRPNLVVERFEVGPSGAVDTLAVDLRLEGTLVVTTLLGTSSTPVALDALVETRLGVGRGEGGTTQILAQPVSVARLELEVPGLASQGLAAWTRATLVDLLPAVVLAELPADALPVRGLRVQPAGDGVRVDLRTAAPHPTPLPDLSAPPDHGFRVRVATDTLLQLARARSFSEGPLAHGVVAEPVSLEIWPDRGSVYGAPVVEGSRGMPFELGLRLWRPVGGGWWRSYLVKGRVVLRRGALELVPDEVLELEHSRGAAVADPLVALAEGTLTRAIGRAMLVTLPTDHTGRFGGLDATVRLDGLTTTDGVLQADGSVHLAR